MSCGQASALGGTMSCWQPSWRLTGTMCCGPRPTMAACCVLETGPDQRV